MAKVTMMIGIPGSGKTTYIDRHGSDSDIIVSPDKIRKEKYGDISIQGDPNYIFGLAYCEVRKALEVGYDVIFDATNTTTKHRSDLITNFRRYGAKEVNAIYINTPIDICKARNKERTDRMESVPEDVMDRMHSSMLRSESSLFSEDFDNVLIVNGSKL